MDEDDPDNYPYDNVEFPVGKNTHRYPLTARQAVSTSTLEKSATLESVAEVPEIIVTESKVSAKSSNLASESSHKTSGGTTQHTSTVMFSRETHNGGKEEKNEQTPTATFHREPPTHVDSPINRLKSSMVESNKQTTMDGQIATKAQTIVRQPQPVTWPFERNDFNTHSQNVLDEAYFTHKSYPELRATIIGQGHALQKPLIAGKEKVRERLTYEQLLQGMLSDGERLLLNGHWVYFNRVEFLVETGDADARPPLGNGRACLTNKRLLLLVAESSTDANLETVDKKSYIVALSQRDDVSYMALPMHCFKSIEMSVSVGAIARVHIERESSICGCLRTKKWRSKEPLVISHNTRTIVMGVTMPPWNKPMTMVIHTHPELPLTLTRDFVALVQSYAQQLH